MLKWIVVGALAIVAVAMAWSYYDSKEEPEKKNRSLLGMLLAAAALGGAVWWFFYRSSTIAVIEVPPTVNTGAVPSVVKQEPNVAYIEINGKREPVMTVPYD